MPNGLTNLNLTPDGWPQFRQHEQVVLFLYRPASRTGLRTTVGLFQGKFTIKNGQVTNGIDNQGLFTNVSVSASELSGAERELVRVKRGPVDAATFLSFVRKAVRRQWFR